MGKNRASGFLREVEGGCGGGKKKEIYCLGIWRKKEGRTNFLESNQVRRGRGKVEMIGLLLEEEANTVVRSYSLWQNLQIQKGVEGKRWGNALRGRTKRKGKK